MGDEFRRPPEGFAYNFLGMKLNSLPDTLPPGKYPIAVNVRGYGDGSVQSRPGVRLLFTPFNNSPSQPVVDMRAYTALNTNATARILAYGFTGQVWKDGSGANVGTLSTAGANGVALGASMIPFRPNASPLPWMYIANGADYQKFSAPAPLTDTVTVQKVGIAEPQSAPNASLLSSLFGSFYIAHGSPALAAGGTAAAATTVTRVSDTVQSAFADPNPSATRQSLQVTSAKAYQRFMQVLINSNVRIVEDVFPALPTSFAISAILYFTGSTGRCVVVPANLSGGPGLSESSIYGAVLLTSLRRGALVKIGAEVCFVWSVTTGPDGSISFETSTVSTHTTADALSGVPAISVISGPWTAGQTIICGGDNFLTTAGVGTQTATISANPFVTGSNQSLQPDDYLHLSVDVDDLTKLNEIKFLIDVGDGSFTQNFYYYTIRPSDIAAGVANILTQLAVAQQVTQRAVIDEENAAAARNQGQTASSAQTVAGSSQWSEIFFPISALTRVGSDETLTLQNAVKWQVLVNANANVNVAIDSIYVTGGFQPDVGDVGAPYLYRVRPRSSLTGVKGNPSPTLRYGTNPRRQSIIVDLPSASYDSQIDTWDVFRYGGSVTSWRFVGSTPSSNSTFIDNFSDSAANAGEELEFDNFEPWPSVDVPNTGVASAVIGTVAVVISTDTDITRYLPGTLVQLGGQNVYTLWTRPTLISGTNYLLQFVENAGASTNGTFLIQEPFIARQFLPYMWGPDANGTVFACGDSFRPGTVSFAKSYAPDAAPDRYNIEISPPSEPLLGGETLDGLSFVASSERWWALYPQPGDAAERYSVVQQPFPRGLAAPFGHCTDGVSIYWWAKDGIYSSGKGSLTDADLYTLFPHEGIAGADVTYNGVTVHAPDYTLTGTFRLTHSNGYLYAIYLDDTGAYRCLTLDLHSMAWCVDDYPPGGITAAYHLEQPPQQGSNKVTLFAGFAPNGVGGFSAVVGQQTVNVNDFSTIVVGSGVPIGCKIATGEWNAGDDRAPKQWGDFFVDLAPSATVGVTLTPMSQGAAVAASTAIAFSPLRQRVPVSVGGVVVSDFMGLFATWVEDFSTGIQTDATKLYLWQPSFVIQPPYTIAWATFGSSFGASGYLHIREIALAYVSSAPITLTIVSYDGQSPVPIVIPSSGGAYVKTLFPLTANKGQLYKFSATCAAKFQLFLSDSEFRVGAWGRQGPYVVNKNMNESRMQQWQGAEAVI